MKEIIHFLNDTVLEAYAYQSDNPAYSPYNNESIFINKLFPYRIIDEQEFGNAWSPTNTTGSQAATENISALVNDIPLLDAKYANTGRKIEEMYKLIIEGATAIQKITPATKGLEPLDNTVLDEVAVVNINEDIAKRIAVQANLEKGADVSVNFLNEQTLSTHIAKIQQSNLLATAIIKAKTKPAINDAVIHEAAFTQQINPALDTHKNVILQQEDIEMASEQYYTIATIFQQAQLLFNRSALASVRNAGIRYHPSYISPANWVNKASKDDWPMLTLAMPDTDPVITVSIAFSRVDILRPWLLASLFDLNGWELKLSKGPGSFSNGESSYNNGIFSLLPQSMIVARDIIATQNGQPIYQAKGLQIMAVINKLIPFCPPKM